MPGLVADRCTRCGRVKSPGDIFYLVRIILTCDFDGQLGEMLDMNEEEIQDKIKDEIRKADEKEEDELMDEVYQELSFYLCKNCRDKFIKHPF